MTLAACAEIVRRGDPDRFLCAMAAPPAARRVLFPIYAFNVEIARAPWVSPQPLIARMRLQWWQDALAEIAEGRPVRRHEVTGPLADAIEAPIARVLVGCAGARGREIDGAPFRDAAELMGWLGETAGALMWASAGALGAPPGHERAVRATGAAQGLAQWLLAVPELTARGRRPLPDGTPDAVAALARAALSALDPRAATGPARAALLPARLARPVLARAARDPAAVAEGRLALSDFAKRRTLLPALFGR